MECPGCGSQRILGGRPSFLSGFAACWCQECGLKWLQPAPPPRPGFLREAEDFFESHRAYCLHGLVVWSIAGALQFLLLIRDPLQALATLGVGRWLVLVTGLLGTGVFLGWSLLSALRLAGRHFPRTPWVHVALPLLFAATVGGLYGAVLAGLERKWPGANLSSHGDGLGVVLGAVLGMLVTPIIIVRSSSVLRSKGLRPELPGPADSRWRR